MHSSIASYQWLLYIFTVISSLQVSAARFNIPRLSPTRGTILQNPEILSATISKDFQTFYYNQTLDHFNYRPESYSTFQQRYVINFKYWGGGAGADANAPIFVYLGAEESLDGDISVIGFLTDNAARFNALLVYIEILWEINSIWVKKRSLEKRKHSWLFQLCTSYNRLCRNSLVYKGKI
ncbi:hypothetical protein CISIN_1g023618mg [Citrus sinensis]|uniref:Uncharacterized protein n=1 Tax=Citrus sinensis TaxID=2711 RepID=A0A067FA25_CITSI|nr:hypothetical protein CISIN_1g023618mg [Citrus sinensis]